MTAEGLALVLHFELWMREMTFTTIQSQFVVKEGTEKKNH